MKTYPMAPLRVKYKGYFDFERLYHFVYEWLHDHKYRTQEDKYKNKPETPFGMEHEVKISGSKKIDGFYKYYMKVVLHCTDSHEEMHDGKKLMKGRIRITITAKVITDYSKRFEKSNFTKWLEKIYTEHIIDREIDLKHLDSFHYRLHEFQQELKKILNMYADTNYFKGA